MDIDQLMRKCKIEAKMHSNGLTEPLKDMILNHGSRGGIDGDIQPISRARCDFGQGFYLGDSDMQAKGLVVNDQAPWFYKIKVHFSEADPMKILKLNEQEWLYMILAHRKLCPEFNELDIAKRMLDKASRYDIIIGAIADDRMNEAIQSFNDYALSDQGLYECLKYIDYGNQYVLKTKEACSLAEIIDQKPLRGQELEYIRTYSDLERKKAKNIVKDMIPKFRNKGKYLDEIISSERSREADRDDR